MAVLLYMFFFINIVKVIDGLGFGPDEHIVKHASTCTTVIYMFNFCYFVDRVNSAAR